MNKKKYYNASALLEVDANINIINDTRYLEGLDDYMNKIKNIINDIKYLEDLGLESDEIYNCILRDYSDYVDNKTIIKAFIKCGYTLKL